ncbi:hypothetical protein J4218_01045 [Candidatus Pacearchaeota archaeon]|nr:hypothetical protein [Candidatus Pacearchaeota archaeon]
MGYPCTDLISAAVLLSNPGITREEFVELLNQTHSTVITSVPEKAPWEFQKSKKRYLKHEDDYLHKGLHGLASYVLSLETTDDFEIKNKLTKDKFGIPIRSPWLSVIGRKYKGEWISPSYEVSYVTETVASEEVKEIEHIDRGSIVVGEILTDIYGLSLIGFVEEVLSEEVVDEHLPEDDFGEYSCLTKSKIKIRKFMQIGKRQSFGSLERLLKFFPQFNPEFMYNFSLQEGRLKAPLGAQGLYKWIQKDGKYYLHPETINKIPAGGCYTLGGYSNLVATAEAIKQKAWKILSYKGDIHIPQFLHDFPDSRKIYENAVKDAQLSISAKLQGMTNTELLRYRMLPPNAI